MATHVKGDTSSDESLSPRASRIATGNPEQGSEARQARSRTRAKQHSRRLFARVNRRPDVLWQVRMFTMRPVCRHEATLVDANVTWCLFVSLQRTLFCAKHPAGRHDVHIDGLCFSLQLRATGHLALPVRCRGRCMTPASGTPRNSCPARPAIANPPCLQPEHTSLAVMDAIHVLG
jgi:hypothetical protein